MKTIAVLIKDWERFNPRKDIRNPSWFRLEHNLFEHPNFEHFTNSELLSWVYLLSIACKKNNPLVTLSLSNAVRIARVKQKTILSAIEKLVAIGLVSYEINSLGTESRNVHVTETSRPRNGDVRYETVRYGTVRDGTEYIGAGSNDHVADGPSKRVRRKSETLGPTPVAQVKDAFLEAYKKEFGKDYPGWGAKENGQTASLLRSITLDKALQYAKVFPTWNDPWVTRQGHAFGILVGQYVQLDAWLTRAETLVTKIAEGRASERVLIGQAQSLAEMRAYAQQQRTRSDLETLESNNPKLQVSSQAGISGSDGEPPGESRDFATPNENDYATGS